MIEKKLIWGRSIILILYCVGIIGLALPGWRSFFVQLTPITLLISTFLLFYFHKDWNKAFIFFITVTYLLGFGIEAFGVATGSIFGEYAYSAVLGPKVADTPLIIGINWLILIYATGTIISPFHWPKLIKALAGAALMVMLDLVMEPVAISLNFWKWPGDIVPLTNYMAWFIISFLLLLGFHYLPFKKGNKFALFIYLVQFGFFIILSVII